MKKILSLFLCVGLLLTIVPSGKAYTAGQPIRLDLSKRIQNPERREYVEMMIDHYARTDIMVRQALEGGFSAVFLFDGASDNMDDPELQDLTYYRVTGVCVVIRLDEKGNPKLVYFNENASTIPDRPLEYGTWQLPEVGEVGPATICDGTYQLYSVRHKGKYEAMHVRTEYWDHLVDAVYMTPTGGYASYRASEVNVHTRTSNHISNVGMWSAGCPLVGSGNAWEYWQLIREVYNDYEMDSFLGTLTVDRQMLKGAMEKLYETKDAVALILENSEKVQPQRYLELCSQEEERKLAEKRQVVLETKVMSLPCSKITDARTRELGVLEPGTEIKVTGSIRNTEGNLWLRVKTENLEGYVYAGHVQQDGLKDWLFDKIFS